MKFFADSANIEEIRYCFQVGVNDGITTNPKILEQTGELTQGVTQAFLSILNTFPSCPVSLEVDLRGIDLDKLEDQASEVKDVLLKQAYDLSKLSPDIVVKIPFCLGVIEATKQLIRDQVKTNVTACMTPYQARCAIDAGTTYVSLFANRMLDATILQLSGHDLTVITDSSDWKTRVKENHETYVEEAWKQVLSAISHVTEYANEHGSELIIGSIRSPEDILKIASVNPHIITIPTPIVRQLDNPNELKNAAKTFLSSEDFYLQDMAHPLTHYTIKEFEVAARTYLSA